nr:MAG TPA: hypothetical protein [Caudoviricetes sp.]
MGPSVNPSRVILTLLYDIIGSNSRIIILG